MGISPILRYAKRLHRLGFKIFDSDRFAEFYISELIGATPEARRDSQCDCVLNGQRIEIKHSKLIDGHMKAKDIRFKYFHWGVLYGVNKKKIGKVDLLILSGFAYDSWHFWVIPYEKVKNNKVEYQVSKRRGKSWSWIEPYFVGDEEGLKEYFNANK